MIEGSCHCGSVRWSFEGTPQSATACSCTACRRYGALWAYELEGAIQVSGSTQTHTRRRWVVFHFCATCGCVAYWRSLHTTKEGRVPMGVNLRMCEPEQVAGIPIVRHDGLVGPADLPRDGRCVADYWF